VNLLTALAIYLGEVPELKTKMKEAAESIKYEQIRSDSFLCGETIRALRKMKRAKK